MVSMCKYLGLSPKVLESTSEWSYEGLMSIIRWAKKSHGLSSVRSGPGSPEHFQVVASIQNSVNNFQAMKSTGIMTYIVKRQMAILKSYLWHDATGIFKKSKNYQNRKKKKDKLLPRVVMVKMKRQSTGERQWKNCGGLVEATNHYIFVPLSVWH